MKNYQRTSKFFAVIVFPALISLTTSSCFLFIPFDKLKQSQEESERQSEIIISRSGDETSSDSMTSQPVSVEISSNPDNSESPTQENSQSSNTSEGSYEYSESNPNSQVTISPSSEEYVKGTLTSNSLKSKYMNISFSAPPGYIMATEEEIDSLVTFAGEIIFKDQNKEIIDYSKANIVYEMFIQDPSGLPNMSIIVEKITSGMSYNDYINALKYQVSNLADMVYTFSATTSDVSVAGNIYKKLSAQLVYMDVEMNQDFYMRIKNDRLISITITYSENTKSAANNLINAIKAYQ